MSKKVCFMLRSSDEKDVMDGLRSTLGLSVANHYSYAVVMTELPPLDEYNSENIDWIRDMEGEVYTTIQANADKNGMTMVTPEELGQKLREMDFIVPYGVHD